MDMDKYTRKSLEVIEKAKDINDPLKKLWEYTLEEDWSGLYFQTHLYLAHEIDEFNRFPNIMDAEFDYRCELVFFPTEAGILAMYFGNDKVRHMLESTKYLKKFFYILTQHYMHLNTRLSIISLLYSVM